MPAHHPPAPNGDTVLGRAMQLLAAFRPGDLTLTLAEIHRRTGMHKSTAFRLLNQLAGWRVIERDADGYRLGLRLFELGQLVSWEHGLRETISPALIRLRETTGHTVHLAMLDGADVVYVHKLDALDGPLIASRIGGRMPAHCTAVGKVMLAHGPDAAVHAVLDRGLRRRSPRTIVVPRLFLGQLEHASESGYARDDEESAVGISCIAAPIFDARNRVVAAVSVTGRSNTLNPVYSLRAVRAAATDATHRLSTLAFDLLVPGQNSPRTAPPTPLLQASSA